MNDKTPSPGGVVRRVIGDTSIFASVNPTGTRNYVERLATRAFAREAAAKLGTGRQSAPEAARKIATAAAAANAVATVTTFCVTEPMIARRAARRTPGVLAVA